MFTLLSTMLKWYLFITFSLSVFCEDIGKLPNCLENFVPGLVLVSTIDGKLSAINSLGNLIWEINTGTGPLLTSNIHNLELTNSGKWIRIIPSLNGNLYKFDGNSIDPISISAESLLKSSFKYSDELIIAGGLQVETYGIEFKSGNIIYTCSALKCTNNTYNENTSVENILLLERTTRVVRAIEVHSGIERWNFSVGHHNIKLPYITCSDRNINLFDWNITAIVPDGLLLASKFEDNIQITWQYHFPSPIVRIWKWNGFKIAEIDLFAMKTKEYQPEFSPSIYIGMHKKQLYIHESTELQLKLNQYPTIKEQLSLEKIPWKPISASEILTEEDSTALSILYSSEYVNGHGYYLYTEKDINKKNHAYCNRTLKIPLLNEKVDLFTKNIVLEWWKEIIVIILTLIIFNFMYKTFSHRYDHKEKVIFVERNVEVPVVINQTNDNEKTIDLHKNTFHSRYMNDFVTLQCLGMGGFGVVFEAKQKIDECHYAIKRIKLPYENTKRERVMREVKALAKLDHNNIVRYHNSWVETPPIGWQQEHDSIWINKTGDFSYESSSNLRDSNISDCNLNIPSTSNSEDNFSNNNDSFIVFKCKSTNSSDSNVVLNISKSNSSNKLNNNCDNDSFIVFESQSSKSNVNFNKKETSSININENSTNTELHTSEIEVSSEKYKPNNEKIINNNCPVFLYIQMQLCKKQSLREWLMDNKSRNFNDILYIFKQIILAVEYVHLQGLIHRDLKPSNIFFSLDGQIKVGDFGLVVDMKEEYDNTGNASTYFFNHTKEVGTEFYMSPEQLKRKKYNYKVDIYSLGLIFCELLMCFGTDMERINTLTDVKNNKYPEDFIKNHPDEQQLITMMLCQNPDKRLTTFGVRARPPINCRDNYEEIYDYDLPKLRKASI